MKSLLSQRVQLHFKNNIQKKYSIFLVHGYLNLYCFMYSQGKRNKRKH